MQGKLKTHENGKKKDDGGAGSKQGGCRIASRKGIGLREQAREVGLNRFGSSLVRFRRTEPVQDTIYV